MWKIKMKSARLTLKLFHLLLPCVSSYICELNCTPFTRLRGVYRKSLLATLLSSWDFLTLSTITFFMGNVLLAEGWTWITFLSQLLLDIFQTFRTQSRIWKISECQSYYSYLPLSFDCIRLPYLVYYQTKIREAGSIRRNLFFHH